MKLRKVIYSATAALTALAFLNVSSIEANAAVTETKVVASTENAELKWIDLGAHQNVDVNKTWKIRFSSNVSLSKIESVVVKTGNLFVPVQLTKNAQNEIHVTPTLGYTGNTDYEMQVLLSNGLKYKMKFKTENAARQADKEPNDSYLNGQTIYADDYVKGALSSTDNYDYYKVIIPADGKFTATATSTNGQKLSLHLYSSKGSDGNSILSDTNVLTGNVSTGLQPGTYYVRVYSINQAVYELKTSFVENTVGNDETGSTYITAEEINPNSEITGHIGFSNDQGGYNENDYYKVVLPENGTLSIQATQNEGGELDMYVYGAYGPDKSYISYNYNELSPSRTLRLQAGTYYIRLKDSGYYGSYNLKTIFTPETVANDDTASNYITAPELSLNKTVYGHIGHTSDNDTYDADDYYKVILTESGTLKVHAKHLQGRELDMYLYGQYGSDRSYIDYVYNFTQETISENLQPGTYYIRIKDSGYAGTYELSTEFIK